MSKTARSKISRRTPITAPLVGAATAELLMLVALSGRHLLALDIIAYCMLLAIYLLELSLKCLC